MHIGYTGNTFTGSMDVGHTEDTSMLSSGCSKTDTNPSSCCSVRNEPDLLSSGHVGDATGPTSYGYLGNDTDSKSCGYSKDDSGPLNSGYIRNDTCPVNLEHLRDDTGPVSHEHLKDDTGPLCSGYLGDNESGLIPKTRYISALLDSLRETRIDGGHPQCVVISHLNSRDSRANNGRNPPANDVTYHAVDSPARDVTQPRSHKFITTRMMGWLVAFSISCQWCGICGILCYSKLIAILTYLINLH